MAKPRSERTHYIYVPCSALSSDIVRLKSFNIYVLNVAIRCDKC